MPMSNGYNNPKANLSGPKPLKGKGLRKDHSVVGS